MESVIKVYCSSEPENLSSRLGLKNKFSGESRTWVISLVIFLFMLQTGCNSAPALKKVEEKVTANDPYTWDFGQVKEGEVLKHEFLLKNETAKALNIKEINTSCGCTASQVKKKTLLPQESTLIEVKFDSKGYSGQTQQFIYVHTDSLDNPIIRYTIKAEVVK